MTAHLFDGLLTLRVGYLIVLLTNKLAGKLQVTRDEAYEHLMQLSPFEVKTQSSGQPGSPDGTGRPGCPKPGTADRRLHRAGCVDWSRGAVGLARPAKLTPCA